MESPFFEDSPPKPQQSRGNTKKMTLEKPILAEALS